VISSCFAQQEKQVSETWLCVEVLDRAPLREESGVGEVGCPNIHLKVRDPNAELRLQVS
jgi:hypothetical protein